MHGYKKNKRKIIFKLKHANKPIILLFESTRRNSIKFASHGRPLFILIYISRFFHFELLKSVRLLRYKFYNTSGEENKVMDSLKVTNTEIRFYAVYI